MLLGKESGVQCEVMWNVGGRQSSDGTKLTAGFKLRKGTVMEKRRQQRKI
jgi:hypothetical protein